MNNKNLSFKYISIVVVLVLLINVLGFVTPFSIFLTNITTDYKVFIYLPYVFGVIISLLAILDYHKFNINLFLFVGIIGVIILSYYTGTLLLVISGMIEKYQIAEE